MLNTIFLYIGTFILGVITAYVIAFLMLYLLWLFYLAVMSLKRARDNGTLSKSAYYLAQPIVIFGVAYDVVCNLTAMSLIMLEIPKEWKVTDRVSRHLDGQKNRGRISRYMCHDFLDPYDPSGCHCKK